MTELSLLESESDPVVGAGTQCLDRALHILVQLTERSPMGSRLKELADITGIPRPTVHRLLGRLVASGLVVQERGTRLYKIGPFFHTLDSHGVRNRTMAQAGLPGLERVAKRFGLTTLLVGRSGRFAQCCARANEKGVAHPAYARVGEDNLLGTSSAGIAILAGLHAEQVEDILFENEWMIAHFGRKPMSEIHDMVAETRRRGFCFAEGSFVPGVGSVAVALPAPRGEAYAALTVVAETGQINEANLMRLVSALKIEASRIVELLKAEKFLASAVA